MINYLVYFHPWRIKQIFLNLFTQHFDGFDNLLRKHQTYKTNCYAIVKLINCSHYIVSRAMLTVY